MTFRSRFFVSTLAVAVAATGVAAGPASAQKKKRGAQAPVMVKAVQGRPIIVSAARPSSTPYIAALKRSSEHLPRGPNADTAHRQRVP